MVRFWREHVESHAGEQIRSLKGHVQDQAEFATLCRSIIADFGLAADLDDQNDGEQNQDEVETMDENQDAESDFSPEDVVLDDESMGDENADGDATMVEMDADVDMDEAGAEADPDEAPVPMPDDAGRIAVDINYESFTEEFDGTIGADEKEAVRAQNSFPQKPLAYMERYFAILDPRTKFTTLTGKPHWWCLWTRSKRLSKRVTPKTSIYLSRA